jgi:hypothetical protein
MKPKFRIPQIQAIIACLLLCTVACTNNYEKTQSNKLDSLKILIEKRNISEYNIGILPCPHCGKQGILTHCENYQEDSANRVPTCWTVYCETTANDTIVGNSCDYMDDNDWFKTQNEAIIAWNKWCISKQ